MTNFWRELEDISLGGSAVAPSDFVLPPGQRLRIVFYVLCEAWRFRRLNSSEVMGWIANKQKNFIVNGVPVQSGDQRGLARISNVILATTRVVFLPRDCLSTSSVLCAVFLRLGVPASLVLGRLHGVVHLTYQFHAWVEVDGWPVNEGAEANDWTEVVLRLQPR
ncbi:MAG: hypothetical protein C5B49_08070 [Bdellovibrio sp.]|nr:MAG: hypothetical protein C5B49_08070 [Bdellovibrio sp.]